MSKIPQTKSDIALNRVVYLDGQKLRGIQRLTVDYDVDKIRTIITLKMVIKKDSLQISNNKIEFEQA